MSLSKNMDIVQINSGKKEKLKDEIVREISLTIFVNDKELITLQCSPDRLEYLAVGFLLSKGLIKKGINIKHVYLNEKDWYIKIDLEGSFPDLNNLFLKETIALGCAGGVNFCRDIDIQGCIPLKTQTQFPYKLISMLMKEFQEKSLTFKRTGGVHSCVLCSKKGIEIFAEDIGRHNAVDKVFGECFMGGGYTKDKFILISGRVSSEILVKIAKRKVSLIASRSAPTDLAINLAEKLNVSLVGFVRGYRMNVYTHSYRVT